MDDYRKRFSVWVIVVATIVVVQVLDKPLRYVLSCSVPPAVLSILLLVALQECFVNWHCTKRIATECQLEEIGDELKFAEVSSRLMLSGALLTFVAAGVWLLGGLDKGWYLLAEAAIIISILLSCLVLDLGLENVRVLLKRRDMFPESVDKVFMALLLNFFIVSSPYLAMFFGMCLWLSSGSSFFSYFW